MPNLDGKPVDEMTFEEAQEELEQIVFRLEEEQHALETTLALFERGQALLQRCSNLLEKAELRVRDLSGGEVQTPGGEE